ncbi:unnamed protein product [Brassicogethes aeneus]|uniref:YqaJ viral recombinase domain-containing protein n=1 Tax=Brassicogethes aeneus TaxID=1431903 RepID=A0A9P0ARD6_BRAAE|nr:unnamed protein product [Brassicogethes aeneus]
MSIILYRCPEFLITLPRKSQNKSWQPYVQAKSDNLPIVDVQMVSTYFAGNDCFNVAESRGVKAQRSARGAYGDNAVGNVELQREGSICTVQCKITPEHKVHNKAYVVFCKINEEIGMVAELSCQSCAASAGGCKHAIAFLMWLHRRSEEPEPTATVCYWKKSRLAQVGTSMKFITSKDIFNEMQNNIKEEKEEMELKADTFLEKLLSEMTIRQSKFQISRHCINFEPQSSDISLHKLLAVFVEMGGEDVEDFLTFAEGTMSDFMCEKIAHETEAQSTSKLWQEMRYGRITASKIHEIAQCHTSNGSLVHQIMGASKIIDTAPMARGRELEKQVIAELQHILGDVQLKKSGLFLSPKYPAIGASPDALGPNFVVEIKCPTKLETMTNYISSDYKLKDKCMAQIQLQMFATKMERGYFCVADHEFESNKQFTLICVEYDEQFTMRLIEKSMLFWKTHVYPLLYCASAV